ncbi:MAG: metabolite traffic protein EboE [Proteobacteria bacterium]|nr:metabolite traffic protein EboE [Pseudomonadota bacterium]
MKLGPDRGDAHLTYCTNIHPGETWGEVGHALRVHLPAVKARLCPAQDFGVGLRLSAVAARDLTAPDAFAELQDILASGGLYVFTINGFPYGTFHGARVKEAVYQPDWRTADRLAYSNRLADLLARLLPEDDSIEGSISTVPGGFKPDVDGPDVSRAMADNMLRHAAHLVALRRDTGRTIALALEPEPCCLLETTQEAVDFFKTHLHNAAAVERLATLTGASLAEAEADLHRHLGVCLDLCHAAVEFEDPEEAVAALQADGIAVPKVQISAGIRLPQVSRADIERIRPFDDAVYLHQVVAKTARGLDRYLDLGDAFAAFKEAERPEWRVHFHVPIFLAALDGFATTRPAVESFLARQRRDPVTRHLEVETYTWDVLPEEHRRDDVVSNIVKEMQWAQNQLGTF